MKRLTMLFMLLLIALTLTACKPKDNANNGTEPTAAPTAVVTQPPTGPTEIPIVTPRPVAIAVETVAPNATIPIIGSIDATPRPKLSFTYDTYTDDALGIQFKYPISWEISQPNNDSNIVMFSEPEHESHDNYPTKISVRVINLNSNQTAETAKAELNNVLDAIRAEFPNLDPTQVDNNKMLGETGPYVNIRIQMDDIYAIRGRVSVFPKGHKLYVIQYMCPANYNTDYTEVYRVLRDSVEEL